MKDEYVRKQDALNAISCDITITGKENAEIVCKAIASFADGIKALPYADVVPVSAYKQVMWERDTAVEQLKQIGKGLGEVMDDVAPVVRCRDCEHYYFADNRIPQEQRYVCEISGEIWKPDDFCSFGKRREE